MNGLDPFRVQGGGTRLIIAGAHATDVSLGPGSDWDFTVLRQLYLACHRHQFMQCLHGQSDAELAGEHHQRYGSHGFYANLFEHRFACSLKPFLILTDLARALLFCTVPD